jgi:hypothetical protein
MRIFARRIRRSPQTMRPFVSHAGEQMAARLTFGGADPHRCRALALLNLRAHQ